MKWHKLLLMIAALAFIVGTFAEEIEIPDDIDDEDLDEDEEILRLLEEKRIMEDLNRENQKAREEASKYKQQHGEAAVSDRGFIYDPCTKIHCQAGRICQVNDNSAECVCVPECPEEYDPRRKVCTNRNETWASDCEVHQQRCFCDTKDTRCRNPKNSHIHIDYYGQCKEIPRCNEEEMLDFPRRMREWLFHVMKELAERQEIDRKLAEKISHVESELNKKWARAAVWKFCDLDATHDQSVSRHELFPIRAPLLSLEHCIAPFLESCDLDRDHRITLKEWGKCLQLEDGDLEGRCEGIIVKNSSKNNEV
jgi:hypothetical protein